MQGKVEEEKLSSTKIREELNKFYNSKVENLNINEDDVDDAILNLGSYSSELSSCGAISKGMIYRALASNDFRELRRISNLFYNVSGMY